MHESGEMYLETIYVLLQCKDSVHAVDIAKRMSFSKASVSKALSNLKSNNYIVIDNRGNIKLTQNGLKIAHLIYDRHLLIQELLEKIGVDKNTASIDACRIEHYISNETFNALSKLNKKL